MNAHPRPHRRWNDPPPAPWEPTPEAVRWQIVLADAIARALARMRRADPAPPPNHEDE